MKNSTTYAATTADRGIVSVLTAFLASLVLLYSVGVSIAEASELGRTLGPSPSEQISPSPSSAKPHLACPEPTAGHAQCLAVIDPVSAGPPLTVGNASASLSASASLGAEPLCFSAQNEFGCGSGALHGFSPQDLQSAYRLPSSSAGSGQTVAIVDAYDDPNAQADLNVYRATYDLPPCEAGCFTKVNQEGGTTYPKPDAGWAEEISLDLDMVSAACPKCHILLVEANDNSVGNLGIAVNEAVTLGATEVSNSYAAREILLGKAGVEEVSKYYVHPGVPITVGSGDSGYNNEQFEIQNEKGECTNCSTSFPAGLASVIAVGGTGLYKSGTSGRGWNEYVWFNSGSGCTLYAAKPTWQVDKGCAQRTDNDVAAVADPGTPVSVYDTYALGNPGWQNIGGTSASAPLLAGAIALESSILRSEGIEGIYSHPANWYDVTSGSNWSHIQPECAEKYLCNGQVGYDGPTGLGTPSGGASTTPPGASTEAASGVTTTGATLNGIVNPEASETTYYFQYGATKSYGKEAPIGGAKAVGYTEANRVSQAISGLTASTSYHYRIVASSAGGTTHGADRVFSTAPKKYLTNFGSKGVTEGKFEGPQATATDVAGNVWVTDYSNNRIEEFSPSGSFLRMCGSTGSGNGQFNGPTGIAVSPIGEAGHGGYIFVSDSGNNRIQVFSPECKFAEAFGTAGSGNGQLSAPMGLAFGRLGPRLYKQPYTLLVADSGNNRVEAFNWATGNAQWKAGAYVASFGTKGSGEGQFVNPTAVVLAGSEKYSTEQFFVVDSGNNRVQKIEEEEINVAHEKVTFKYISQFGSKGSADGQLLNPTGIALDPTTGDLAVTDTGNNRVEEFLPNGTYVAKFGAKGTGAEAFEGPKGISVNSAGTLFVADTGNNRVDVWQSVYIPGWRITTTPNPAGAVNSYLWGVSCLASACTAVGEYSIKGAGTEIPMAERWNGTEWQLQTTPNPAGTEKAILASVSCSSSNACMASGYYQNGSGVYLSLTESWNGSEWKIQPTAEPAGALNSLISSVSCSSPTECTAVGWYENSSGIEVPWAERWNGTAWSLQSLATPSGATATFPDSVSCLSSTSCTLVGRYKNSSGVLVPFSERWNGSAWSIQSMPAPTGATQTYSSYVSCTSSTACTVAGYYLNAAGSDEPYAERWNGSTWSLQSMPEPSGTKHNLVDGVSCASATVCTTAGVSQTTAGKNVTFVERWNGTTWEVQSTPNNGEGKGWLSGGVSCASTTSCAAVGNTGKTFAEIYE